MSTHLLKSIFIFFLSISLGFITACGGGGSEPIPVIDPITDDNNDGNDNEDENDDEEPGLVSIVVEGSISYTDTSALSMDPTLLAPATEIEIIVQDAEQSELSSVRISPQVVLDKANFEQEIEIPEENGTIIINIEKPGFAGFSRRYIYQDANTFSLSLVSDLKQSNQVKLPITDVVTASKKQRRGFSVSLSRKKDGSTQAKAGIYQKQLSDESVLSITIPPSAVPAGVTELDAGLRSFNPNNPVDATSFPGAYADSDGNTLLSVAFDFADIRTPDGVKLSTHVKNQLKNSGLPARNFFATNDPVVINRTIPSESCAALAQLGDADAEMEGFQVPVYTYNPESGLWDLIGKGTIYDADGNPIPEDQTEFDCATTFYTLEIEVTNEIFLSDWWNLDYPLVFDEPVQLCANILVKSSSGTPVNQGMIAFYDDDEIRSFSQDYYFIDNQGKATVQTILTDGSTDRSASVSVWDLHSEGSTAHAIELSESCEIAPVQEIILQRPDLCQIQGQTVQQDGSFPESLPIYSMGIDGLSFDYTETNSQGEFELDAYCGIQTQIFTFSSLFGDDENGFIFANVNGSVDFDETSDNGEVAVLNTIEIEPLPPFGFVFNNEESFSEILLVAYDIDDDFPLSYEFNITNSTSEVVASFSGSLTEADKLEDGSAQKVIAFEIPDGVTYLVQGTITDNMGASSILAGILVGRSD